MIMDSCAAFLCIEAAHRALFKNVGTRTVNFGDELSQIFPWVKLCLIGKMHAGQLEIRHSLDISRIEAEFAR